MVKLGADNLRTPVGAGVVRLSSTFALMGRCSIVVIVAFALVGAACGGGGGLQASHDPAESTATAAVPSTTSLAIAATTVPATTVPTRTVATTTTRPPSTTSVPEIPGGGDGQWDPSVFGDMTGPITVCLDGSLGDRWRVLAERRDQPSGSDLEVIEACFAGEPVSTNDAPSSDPGGDPGAPADYRVWDPNRLIGISAGRRQCIQAEISILVDELLEGRYMPSQPEIDAIEGCLDEYREPLAGDVDDPDLVTPVEGWDLTVLDGIGVEEAACIVERVRTRGAAILAGDSVPTISQLDEIRRCLSWFFSPDMDPFVIRPCVDEALPGLWGTEIADEQPFTRDQALTISACTALPGAWMESLDSAYPCTGEATIPYDYTPLGMAITYHTPGVPDDLTPLLGGRLRGIRVISDSAGILLDDGRVRIYFDGDGGRSFVTAEPVRPPYEDISFRVDEPYDLPGENGRRVGLGWRRVLVLPDGRVRMYGFTTHPAQLHSFTSDDGLRFRKDVAMNLSSTDFDLGLAEGTEAQIGSYDVLAVDGGYRLYVEFSVSPDALGESVADTWDSDDQPSTFYSAFSADGLHWTVEDGERIGESAGIEQYVDWRSRSRMAPRLQSISSVERMPDGRYVFILDGTSRACVLLSDDGLDFSGSLTPLIESEGDRGARGQDKIRLGDGSYLVLGTHSMTGITMGHLVLG